MVRSKLELVARQEAHYELLCLLTNNKEQLEFDKNKESYTVNILADSVFLSTFVVTVELDIRLSEPVPTPDAS